MPTETVYGLAANALDPEAVTRIFAAKGRPNNNPLIVHITDGAQLRTLVADWPSAAASLADRFWPGPLTLVLPRSGVVPDAVTGGGPTVAVRMPRHPVMSRLIQLAGIPLAAPSANRSTELSPTRAEHVVAGLDGRIDLILDGGPTTAGIESTVLSLTGPEPLLLRPGPIAVGEIESIVGPIRRAGPANEAGPLPSPGLLARHYAPRTRLQLVESAAEAVRRVDELRQGGLQAVAVTIGPTDPSTRVIAMPNDAPTYAAQLFNVLHNLDALGLDQIVVERPPNDDSWLAVADRLQRAVS